MGWLAFCHITDSRFFEHASPDGHSKIANTDIYLTTGERRMSQAIRRASGIDVKREIIALYKAVRRQPLSDLIFYLV